MRFIMTIFWATLISAVLSYVLTSMANEPFNVTQTLSLMVGISIAIFLLDAAVLTEQED